MPRHLKLWIAIADGEHARIVQPGPNRSLHTIRAIESATAHQRVHDLVSDRQGRVHESAAASHHAVEPRHDPHRLQMERFAQLIGQELNAAAADGAFDELVLVAPARTAREISAELNQAATAKLVGTLEKDLVKTPNEELWPFVSAWIGPTHGAAR